MCSVRHIFLREKRGEGEGKKRLNALKRATNLTDAGILFQNTKYESTEAVISIFLSHTIGPHPTKLYRHHVKRENSRQCAWDIKLLFFYVFIQIQTNIHTQHEEIQDEMWGYNDVVVGVE